MRFFKPEEFIPQLESIYTKLREQLLRELPFAEVDHVGSSAIRGAISKGDLDILVRVAKENFHSAHSKIQTLGFFEKEGTLRTESLCMFVTESYDLDVAIQLVEKGSEFEMFIKFRDALNENPALVIEYNRLKEASIGLSPDEYRKRKSLFIESVLRR